MATHLPSILIVDDNEDNRHHLDDRRAGRPTGGVGYYVSGAFYDAPNDRSRAALSSTLGA
jgi:hypothetical protein